MCTDLVIVGATHRIHAEDIGVLQVALADQFLIEYQATLDVLVESPSATSESVATRPPVSYTFGIDLDTVIALSLVSMPALVAKKLLEEASKDLWSAIKHVFSRIAERHRSVPISSYQVQVRVPEAERSVTITVLNARHMSEETWLCLINAAMTLLRREADLTEPRRDDAQPVCHVVVPSTDPSTIYIHWNESS